MKLAVTSVVTLICLSYGVAVRADCPLDHLLIGCNRDGVEGTDDDTKLFVDCSQKYRDSGETDHANWFYPLQKSIFSSYGYRIGEPGFDVFQSTNANAGHTYDPNRAPAGEPDLDFGLIVECYALSDGLRAVHKEYPQFTIAGAGESFDHSAIHALRGDGHVHLSYQAVDGESLHWITYRLHDRFGRYESSEPFTVVFNVEPLAGDLVVDDAVDLADMAALSHCWLRQDAARQNDYWERADTNRDGAVNLIDFARMAANWRVAAIR
jgi:hypothetical protein